MCGTCCYGEGGITLQQNEIRRISVFLGIDQNSFLSGYCEKRNGRLSVKTGVDGFCVFYGGEGKCLIHPVKPGICSLWPFYPAIVKDRDAWEIAKAACPGINPDCPFDEFVKQSVIK
jgi:Fe-S-cluster containining protein